jgi:hypothetical protein
MKKRIFNWHHSKNKRYAGRKCPNFDFVEACVKDIVIWWDENQYCVDMDRINEVKKPKEG